MSDVDGHLVLAEIKQAMSDPNANVAIVPSFTHGRGVQVRIKTRKVGPIIFPTDEQSLADVLHMLGTFADEAVR